jgi:hypothetical protein
MAQRSDTQLPLNEADIQLAISSIDNQQIQVNGPAAVVYSVAETTLRHRRAGIPARLEVLRSQHMRQRASTSLETTLHTSGFEYGIHTGRRFEERTQANTSLLEAKCTQSQIEARQRRG